MVINDRPTMILQNKKKHMGQMEDDEGFLRGHLYICEKNILMFPVLNSNEGRYYITIWTVVYGTLIVNGMMLETVYSTDVISKYTDNE